MEFELSLTAQEINQGLTENILLDFHKTLQMGNSWDFGKEIENICHLVQIYASSTLEKSMWGSVHCSLQKKKKGIGKETEITDNEEKTLAEEHSFINTLS